MRTIVCAATAAVFLGGCGAGGGGSYQPKEAAKIAPASVKPGEEASLFPLAEGNQWTYTVDVQEVQNGQPLPPTTAEMNWRVMKVEKTPNGTNAIIDIYRMGELADRQEWRITDKGIYQVATGKELKPFSAPQTVIVFPVETGKKFTWKGSGALPGNVTGTSVTENTILAPMEVDTALGRLSAIPVDTKVDFTIKNGKGKGVSTIWFTPGVGMVRYSQKIAVGNTGAQFLMKLKSKSIKG